MLLKVLLKYVAQFYRDVKRLTSGTTLLCLLFVLSLSTPSLLYRSEMIYLFEYSLSIFYKRVLKRLLDSLSDSLLLFRHVLSHPVLGAAVVQVLKRSTVLSDTSAVFQKPSPKTQRDSTWGKIQTT